MHIGRRQLLRTAALAGMAGAAPAWAATRVLTPEQFGAKGDGVTNDTDAFALLAQAVTLRGGGEIALRRTTYLVGRQFQAFRSGAVNAFQPAKIMEFVGLRGALVIRGNGARLKCAPGLRYGTFNPVTGAKTNNPMPYIKSGEVASPYAWMILAQDCAGPVEITDIELDGNLPSLRIGGQYGDTGWQLRAVGLGLVNNRGTERVARVYSHHHAQDGMQIDGLDASRGSAVASRFEDVRCEHNGRQGLSLVGGRGYSFVRSKFNHTGKSVIASAPGSGVDIEAEAGKKVRDISFSECEFSNNTGASFVSDSGDSEGITFTGCTLIGTTNWAAWLNKPRIRFFRSLFVGPIVHAFGHAEPERATQFHDCTFRDDPALSPTRQVYGGENPDRPIADLPGNLNVLFNRCKFLLTHQAVLPWSVNVTYANCTMSQRSPKHAYPRGFYVGRNTIYAPVNITGSLNSGTLLIGTRSFPQGRL